MDETTLPAPQGSELRVETELSDEQLPTEVTIYAMDRTITHLDSVSSQGFGTSTPLENPRHEITYHWRGRLHVEPRTPDSQRAVVSSNANSDIKVLAQNFAYNYRNHQNPDLVARGEPSYSIQFEPSKELVEEISRQFGEGTIFRGLTPQEQETFMAAFREANESAVKQQ